MIEFAKYSVVELGNSLQGALCGSHLGALGMSVHAWRTEEPGAVTPADLGWDWSKTISTGPPTATDLAAADIVLHAGAQPIDEPRPGTVVLAFEADYEEQADQGPELLLQARSGLIGYVGHQERQPIRIGAPVVTFASAVAGVQAVLAALIRREQTGQGSRATVSALAVALALAGNNVTSESDPDEITGFALQPHLPPRVGYQCADGTVDFVFHKDDDGFATFCEWLSLPEMAHDPRFVSHAARQDHESELADELTPALTQHATSEVLERLETAGALFARRYPVSELVRHPQVAHLDLLGHLSGPGRQVRSVAHVPFIMNGTRPQATEPITKSGKEAGS